MKKMLFSAMALVAFTATSMAGEIKKKTKEEIPSQNLKIENSITLFKLVKMPNNCADCFKWADSLDNGTDPTNQIWMGNMNKCYRANNCEEAPFPVD